MQLLRTSDKYDSCVHADIKCGMNIDARHASHFRLIPTREKNNSSEHGRGTEFRYIKSPQKELRQIFAI